MHNTEVIGDIQDLFDAKVNMLVVKRALPEVVAYLITQRGAEQAEIDLRDIANTITQRLLLIWSPKSKKPFKVFKEMMRVFFCNKKVKGKVLERTGKKKPSKIAIRDYDCPLCPDITKEEIEISQIHYCTAVSGSIEAVLRHVIKNTEVPYNKVKCETVKSVGSGDEVCEHIINLEYKERG